MSRPDLTTTASLTGATGSAVLVLIWVAGMLGVELTVEVGAALVVVISTVAGYLIPARTTTGGKHAA